jgi:hypothetical protein
MAHVTVINEHQHLQQVVSGHHHLTAERSKATAASQALRVSTAHKNAAHLTQVSGIG